MQNLELELASQFALHTAQSFFLTGKAGSGKTTLLKNIAGNTTKNIVIVAPTGVAAINAGGVTIHSMFGLPLTTFIPTNDPVDPNQCTNRRALLDHMKLRRDKVRVIREMDLLVIDEISMVRADVLDAIDFVLRTVRRIREPMGGVQVMLIGDMYQLPPVVKPNDWAIMQRYYTSPYFFDSLVWKELNAVEIELKKVFRQTDSRFVSLLNNIRNQELNEDDFELLRARYQPQFDPKEPGYILLSTHNAKADAVNEQELGKLAGRMHVFEAEVTGDFPEHAYPCDRVLQLKVGAQVMFIRNDQEEAYFNGKIARIKTIDENGITVTFQDSGTDYVLKKEKWESINYKVDDHTGSLDKDVLGTFSQYPLRLAWAVTIHKSQGLTFDKVIIDAGKSFAAGQVYVALSRCRTLDGIVLHSMITQASLHGDPRIHAFSESHHSSRELQNTLEEAKERYGEALLKKLFTFQTLTTRVEEWRVNLFDKEFEGKQETMQLYENVFRKLESMTDIANKFRQQIATMNYAEREVLRERCGKAVDYFTEFLFTHYLTPIHTHASAVALRKRMKGYVVFLNELLAAGWKKVNQLYAAHWQDAPLYEGPVRFFPEMLKAPAVPAKREAGSTYRDTLELLQKGFSVDEIATTRGMAKSTIKGHLARLVGQGQLELQQALDSRTIEQIMPFFERDNDWTYAHVKSVFGEAIDYSDVRIVQAWMERKRSG
ncbi:MAG: AAA family ATPase [Chitinophagales bacterium]